jgi:type II secretory pathway component HofQ
MKKTFFVLLALFAITSGQPQPRLIAPAKGPLTVAPTPAVPITTPASPSTSAAIPANIKDSLYPIERIPVSDTIKIPVLDFKNADIRDVLRGLGMQYGLNIFTDPDVQGPVTLYLTNVTLRSAIDFIVKRSGNAYAVESGIVKVYKYKALPPPPPPKPPATFHLTPIFATPFSA